MGLGRTLELLRAYGVDAVVVNGRFDRPVATDYWSMNPALSGPTLAKFRSHPDLFQPVFETPGASVFALTDAARHGALPADDAPREPFTLTAEAAAQLGQATIDGVFAQHGTRIAPSAAPGDTLPVTTWWSLAADSTVMPGSYVVFLRLDARAMPHGPLWSPAWDKVYRKGLERWTGRRWRFRTTHHPLDGVFAPDLWRPGEIVEDRYDVALPPNLAPGDYDVRVRMVRVPHYPNTRLADYLHDDDGFSGPVVGRLTVAAPGAPGAAP